MGWILPKSDCECECDDCGNPHPFSSRGTEYVATDHDVYLRFNRADLELLGNAKGVEAQAIKGRGIGARVDASGEG